MHMVQGRPKSRFTQGGGGGFPPPPAPAPPPRKLTLALAGETYSCNTFKYLVAYSSPCFGFNGEPLAIDSSSSAVVAAVGQTVRGYRIFLFRV